MPPETGEIERLRRQSQRPQGQGGGGRGIILLNNKPRLCVFFHLPF